MKKMILVFCIFFSVHTFSQEKLCKKVIEKTNMKKEFLTEGITVFLILSYECGYCIKDIPYYNSMFEKFNSKVKFIALMENDSLHIANFENKYKTAFNCIKIPNAESIYSNFWKNELYPQVHIYKKGILQKILLDASENTKQKTDLIIQKLLKSD